MLVLQLVPIVLSLLVLSAHFLRRGDIVLVVAALALIGLTAVPRPWAARSVQIALRKRPDIDQLAARFTGRAERRLQPP